MSFMILNTSQLSFLFFLFILSYMNNNTFFGIHRRVGTVFLKYVLNYNLPIRNESTLEELGFNTQQKEVLNELNELIKESEAIAFSNQQYHVNSLLITKGGIDDGRFNDFRRKCGGEILIIKSENAVEEFLFQYALLIYPVLLFSPENKFHYQDWIFTGKVAEASTHFIGLLRKDLVFSRLILGDESHYWSYYLLENGALMTSSQYTILIDFINRCFTNCCYRMDFSLTALINEIKSNLTIFKKIASGEEFEYSCFLGLRGLGIREMEALEVFPSVILRPIPFLENPLSNLKQTAIIHGDAVIGTVLELKQKVKAKIDPEPVSSSTFSIPEIDLIASFLKFAIVFATELEHPPFNETFFDIGLPLYHKPAFIQEIIKGGMSIIDKKNYTEIQDWLALLKKSDLSHLNVSLKRLQYAIFERRETEDALLDAFIAWESMFSGKTETVFQVTGSIAKFLTENYEERGPFLKRLKELYDLRSFIAHGKSEEPKIIKKEDINDIKNEVISIGVNCLKKLLNTPKLISISAPERAKQLLIFS